MFVLICWGLSSALMFLHSTAEQQYFIPNMNHTWEDARNHCQVCFKELVTLTPQNAQAIAQRISSDHWIGLRKNFNSKTNSTNNTTSYASSNFTWSYNSYFMNNLTSNSTSNSTSSTTPSWTQWANGDPLAFQNWYPGWPVFKSFIPKRDCCSCSCTCPAKPTPTMSSFTRYTQFTTTQNTPNVTNSNTTTNITTTDIPDFTDLTNFTDLTDITAQNATGFTSLVDSNTDNTTTPRTNHTTAPFTTFTTATPHTTTELPIESTCTRSPMPTPDVPDIVDNYIEDSCVAMLSFGPWVEKSCLEVLPFVCYDERFYGQVNVTAFTSNSATLIWESAGYGISHYRIEVKPNKTVKYHNNLNNLTYDLVNLEAGTLYEVQVFPVKCERDLNPENATFYTSPNKVTNLRNISLTETSVSLSWDRPVGALDFYLIKYEKEITTKEESIEVSGLTPGSNYTFTITAGVQDNSTWSEDSYITVYTKPDKVSNLKVSNYTATSLRITWEKPRGGVKDYVVQTSWETFNVTSTPEFEISGLQMASKTNFTVAARNQNNLKGESLSIIGVTAPGRVQNLTLRTTSNTLDASWIFPQHDHVKFIVELELGDDKKNVITSSTQQEFTELKTAANYTVTVTAVSGEIRGQPVKGSNFTFPLSPRDPKSTTVTKSSITFEWKPPDKAGDATYRVIISSSFWNESQIQNVKTTNHTFKDLKSGSNYTFQVVTVAGGRYSTPATTSAFTVADKREVTLSLLCSSPILLQCDSKTTRDALVTQWKTYFEVHLGRHVFWELKSHTDTGE